MEDCCILEALDGLDRLHLEREGTQLCIKLGFALQVNCWHRLPARLAAASFPRVKIGHPVSFSKTIERTSSRPYRFFMCLMQFFASASTGQGTATTKRDSGWN